MQLHYTFFFLKERLPGDLRFQYRPKCTKKSAIQLVDGGVRTFSPVLTSQTLAVLAQVLRQGFQT